jgi:hypothetical protein
LGDHGRWASREAGCLGVEFPSAGGAGVCEKGAVCEDVTGASPVPALPSIDVASVVRNALSHLLEGAGGEEVALAVDGGILAASDRIHEPRAVVVIHDVEVAIPAPEASTKKKNKHILRMEK